MASYLDLCNMVILETGDNLDQLDSSTFASPSESMARKIKSWTAKAWKEIQLESNDWQFLSKQAQLILRPRLLIVEGDAVGGAPPAGLSFTGLDTGATFELVDVVLLEGMWVTGDVVAYLEYTDLEGEFKWNETYESDPFALDFTEFRLKWWGRYNLQSEVSGLLEPDLATFFIQSTGGSADQANTATPDNRPLTYVPWATWLLRFEGDSTSRGTPECFTMTPDGLYDFWPRMDQEFVISFQYAAQPQELEDEEDVPEGIPLQYQDMIAWRAAMYYADYQQRPDQFARCERRYQSYKNRMERNQKPKYSFAGNAFNNDGYGWRF